MSANLNRLRIGFVIAAFAVGLLGSGGASSMPTAAWAQASPTPTPRPLVHVPIPLPINAPKGWAPQQWASFRAKCQEYSDKAHSGTPLTRSQFTMLDTCGTFAPYPASATRPPTAGQPKSPPPVALPTPVPTPGSESSLSDPPGIGPYGTPIIADSEDACVAGQGEPPDLAADVSPTETNCQFY